MQKETKHKKIAYAAESFGIRAQLGAIQYGANELEWTVRCFISAGGRFDRMFAWQPDGVIVNLDRPVERKRLLRICKQRGVPVVCITWDHIKPPNIPSVAFNSIQIGQLAAKYFCDLGLSSFAFIGHPNLLYSRLRRKGFIEFLKAAGHETQILSDAEVFDESLLAPQYAPSKEALIVDWLNEIEEGTGIFFANDRQAFIFSEIALFHGIKLKGRFPMLGVDNDPFFCESTCPKLSSVPVPFESLGISALEMFKDHFQGKLKPNALCVLEPLPVISRESTEIQVSSDPLVQKAMAYIEANLEDDCKVVEMAKHLGVSLPTLHSKFNEFRGRTPHDEIVERRFRKAERLLRETTLSVKEVAAASGFNSRARFTNAFKNRNKCSPSSFREVSSGVAGTHRAYDGLQ